jgi:pyrroline-5-carboxylate reductase
MAFERILLVGCGNMAGAMLRGWLAGGVASFRFTVADPAVAELPPGVTRLRAVPAEAQFDAILLGVKPQLLEEVAPQVEALAGSGTVVFSILAGVELAVLAKLFPRANAIVRLMPNLAAALGKSPIALAANDASARQAANELMEPLGRPEWFEEADFDLVTALAGSGPAFVYRFIDALASAAAELGLAPDKAARLALAMVEGAAALAAQSDVHPGELADRVASPGGTTRAGLDVLDADGRLASIVLDTLRAARDRSAQMAAEARGQR